MTTCFSHSSIFRSPLENLEEGNMHCMLPYSVLQNNTNVVLTGTKILFCCLLRVLLLILRCFKNSLIYLYPVFTSVHPIYIYSYKYKACLLVLKVTSLSAKRLSNILQRVTIFRESVYCRLCM